MTLLVDFDYFAKKKGETKQGRFSDLTLTESKILGGIASRGMGRGYPSPYSSAPSASRSRRFRRIEQCPDFLSADLRSPFLQTPDTECCMSGMPRYSDDV